MFAEMDISGDKIAEASERSERSFRISLFVNNKERERRKMTAEADMTAEAEDDRGSGHGRRNGHFG